jgi:hypothetical protein
MQNGSFVEDKERTAQIRGVLEEALNFSQAKPSDKKSTDTTSAPKESKKDMGRKNKLDAKSSESVPPPSKTGSAPPPLPKSATPPPLKQRTSSGDQSPAQVEAKSSDAVSVEPVRNQEDKDAPQTKRGGDPSEVQTEERREGQANAQTKAEGQVSPEKPEGQATAGTPSSDSSSSKQKEAPKPPARPKRDSNEASKPKEESRKKAVAEKYLNELSLGQREAIAKSLTESLGTEVTVNDLVNNPGLVDAIVAISPARKSKTKPKKAASSRNRQAAKEDVPKQLGNVTLVSSEELSDDEKQQVKILDKMGVSMRFVNGRDLSLPGLFRPSTMTIWINRNYVTNMNRERGENSKWMTWGLFAHEAFHAMKVGNPEAWNQLYNWVSKHESSKEQDGLKKAGEDYIGDFDRELLSSVRADIKRSGKAVDVDKDVSGQDLLKAALKAGLKYDIFNKDGSLKEKGDLSQKTKDLSDFINEFNSNEDIRQEESLSRYLEDRAGDFDFWNELGNSKPGLLAKIGRWLRKALRFAEPDTLAGQVRLAIESAMESNGISPSSGGRASPARSSENQDSEASRVAEIRESARSATPDEHDALIAIANKHSKRDFVKSDITPSRIKNLKSNGLVVGSKLTPEGLDRLRSWDKKRKQAIAREAKLAGVDPDMAVYGLRVEKNKPWLLTEDIISNGIDTSLIPQDLEARSDSQKNNLKRTKWDVAQWLQSLYKKASGHSLSPNSKHSKSAKARMANQLAKEALHALKMVWAKGAIGWYNEKVTGALDHMADIFPEIVAPGKHQMMFKAALAISSDGQDVLPNFRMAVEIYERWKKTGTLSGWGHRSGVESSLDTMDKLVKKFGWERVEAFLATPLTAAQLSKHGFTVEDGIDPSISISKESFKVGGELVTARVYGSMIFGAKIGSFYNNLNYRFDTITMDLWWSRTIGRLRGKLESVNVENAQKSIDNGLRKNLSDKYLKKFGMSREDVARNDRAALRYARMLKSHNASVFTSTAISSYVSAIKKADELGSIENGSIQQFAPVDPSKLNANEKKFYGQLSEKIGNSKVAGKVSSESIAGMARDAIARRTEVNTTEFKAAKNVVVNAYGLYEIAKSGKDREVQREVAELAIKQVKEVIGKDITKADFQALMWYYEKELWGKLGLSKEIEKLDYEQAAKKVSQEHRASKRDGRRESISSGQRVSPEATGRAQSTVQSGEDAGSGRELDGGEYAGSGADGTRAGVGRQRPESAGDGRGRKDLRKNSPLAGSPSVPGINGPDPEVVAVAERYAKENGIDLKRQAEYVQVDPERAKRIADAYEQMAHAPQDPKVKAAYKELIKQTTAQYKALADAGYKFWFMDLDVPSNVEYASSPYNALRDLRQNKQMGVFPTSDGFGTSDLDVNDNPLLEDTGIKWPSGGLDGQMKPVTANDLFRAVHDAFGHSLEGAGFRARGEENAWQAHVRLFTGDAVGAITSETRGQNSWLNYGPHGDKNRTAKVEDTTFADQKTGLMPEWTWTEGRAADYSETTDRESTDGTTEKDGSEDRSRKTRERAAVAKRSGREATATIRSRVGSNGRAWSRSEESRTLGGYGVVATYEADAAEWADVGVAAPSFVELQKSEKSASQFTAAINAARESQGKLGASVYVYPEQDYRDMRLFLTEDGKAGFALKDSGEAGVVDIVSVFNTANNAHRGVSYSMMRLAVEEGGNTLDAFDTFLPVLYSANGFRVISRAKWSDEFAPSGWSKEEYSDFNNGEPDVVFMAYDPQRTDIYRHNSGEGKAFDDIDEAVRSQRSAAIENATALDSRDLNSGLRYAIARPELAKELDKGETVTLYRAMTMIDGNLYPPMSSKINDGKKLSLRKPEPVGKWMVAEERPDLVPKTGKYAGKFPLKKPKGTTWAAYAPYFHASPIPLNDQFTASWYNDGVKRPKMVIVEVEVPASEMTSGYQAEGSSKKVGSNKWTAGVVASKLPGGREVVLSRYLRIKRIVPDAEVAKKIADIVNPSRLSIPENTVTPQLRAELEKNGVRISPKGTKGESIRYSPSRQVDSPAFKKWFGDWENDPENSSKIVWNGQPLSLYHGTKRDFNVFEGKAKTSTDGGYYGKGYYFTTDSEGAGRYAGRGDGSRILEVYVDIKNPAIINDTYRDNTADALSMSGGKLDYVDAKVAKVFNDVYDGDPTSHLDPEKSIEITKRLKEAGYDGVIVNQSDLPFAEVVAFDSSQIKSATGNRGTFDKFDPDIRYSPSRQDEMFAKLMKAMEERGLAKPGQSSLPETTGTKYARTEGQRKSVGDSPREWFGPRKVKDRQKKAIAELAANPGRPYEIISEMNAKPRPLTDMEDAILNARIRELKNEGDISGSDRKEWLDLNRTVQRGHSEWGYAGHAAQAELASDFSVEGLTRQHTSHVEADPSPEQIAKYAEMAERIDKLEAETAALAEKLAKEAIARKKAEAASVPKTDPPREKIGTKRATLMKKVADGFAAFQNAWGGGSSGRAAVSRSAITNVNGFGFGTDTLPDPSTVSRDEWLRAYMPLIMKAIPESKLSDEDIAVLGTVFGDENPFKADSKLMRMFSKWTVQSDLQERNWAEGVQALFRDRSRGTRMMLEQIASESGVEFDEDRFSDPSDYKALANSFVKYLPKYVSSNPDIGSEVTNLLDASKVILDPLEYAIKAWEDAQGGAGGSQIDTAAFKKWFGDSKVVDEDGNPLVVYHGTNEKFSVFESGRTSQRSVMLSSFDVETSGFFFSPSEDDARQYGKNVLPVYLSVQNRLMDPKVIGISSRSSEEVKAASAKAFEDAEYILEPMIYEEGGKRWIDTGGGVSNTEVDSDGDWINEIFIDGMIDWHALDNPKVVERMKERGYDGVKVYEENDGSGESWFVVESSQVKSATSNTGDFDKTNPDIRYSPSRQGTDIKSAADSIVNALREMGVSSVLELESQVKANMPNVTLEQMSVIKDAWAESNSKKKVESPIGDDPEPSAIGARAKELMTLAIEAGYGATNETWREVVDVVHAQLSIEVPGISEYDTMQAMSDYGSWRPLNKEEIAVKTRAIRGKTRQSLKIEDTIKAIAQSEEWLKNGVSPEEVARRLRDQNLLPKSTGREQPTPDSIERDLIAEFNKLKKELPVSTESREGQLKSALSTAKTAGKNRLEMLSKDIEALEEAIESRTVLARSVNDRTPLKPDAELASIRSQLEAKRKQRDDLKTEYEKIFPRSKKQRMLSAEQQTQRALKAIEKLKEKLQQVKDGKEVDSTKKPSLVAAEVQSQLKMWQDRLRAARQAAAEAEQGRYDDDGGAIPAQGGRKPMTEEQRLAMAERMLQSQIDDIKADTKSLTDGTWAPAVKGKVPTSSVLESLRAQLADLRKVRDEARKASPVYQAREEAKYWERYRKGQERRLAFWEKRRDEAKSGILPVPRNKRTITEEDILDKNLEIEKIKYEAMYEIEKAKRATWNAGQWMQYGLLEATSLIPKTLMLGMELSFFLRQGFFYSRSHPVRAFMAAVEAIPAVWSQRLALASVESLESRPNAKEYLQAEVEFTKKDGPRAQLEEMYQSAVIRWLENTKTPWLLPFRAWVGAYGAFERGNRTFANIMKADLYDIQKRDTLAAREFFGTNMEWTDSDIKEAGRITNIFSGRGTGLRGGSPWLDFFFLARRWTWSRIQADFILPLQLATPSWIGQWNADRGMRVSLAKLYIQTLMGHATKMAMGYFAYSLLAGDDEEKEPTIEWDPRSSDAWVMKVGETRFKDDGGLMPAVVLASRLLTGTIKTSSGEIKSIYGEDVQYGGKTGADFLINFARYKLGTGPASILEWVSGKDAVGRNIAKEGDPLAVPKHIIGSRLTPLTWKEIAAAEKELGVVSGTLASLEAFFGVSVSTYGPRTEYSGASDEEKKELFDKDLRGMKWDDKDLAYSDSLSGSQKKQARDAQQKKKQSLVYAASANPSRKNYKSDQAYKDAVTSRDEYMKTLKKSGISMTEARRLLIEHWEDNYGSAKETKKGVVVYKEGLSLRLRQLRKVFTN